MIEMIKLILFSLALPLLLVAPLKVRAEFTENDSTSITNERSSSVKLQVIPAQNFANYVSTYLFHLEILSEVSLDPSSYMSIEISEIQILRDKKLLFSDNVVTILGETQVASASSEPILKKRSIIQVFFRQRIKGQSTITFELDSIQNPNGEGQYKIHYTLVQSRRKQEVSQFTHLRILPDWVQISDILVNSHLIGASTYIIFDFIAIYGLEVGDTLGVQFPKHIAVKNSTSCYLSGISEVIFKCTVSKLENKVSVPILTNDQLFSMSKNAFSLVFTEIQNPVYSIQKAETFESHFIITNNKLSSQQQSFKFSKKFSFDCDKSCGGCRYTHLKCLKCDPLYPKKQKDNTCAQSNDNLELSGNAHFRKSTDENCVVWNKSDQMQQICELCADGYHFSLQQGKCTADNQENPKIQGLRTVQQLMRDQYKQKFEFQSSENSQRILQNVTGSISQSNSSFTSLSNNTNNNQTIIIDQKSLGDKIKDQLGNILAKSMFLTIGSAVVFVITLVATIAKKILTKKSPYASSLCLFLLTFLEIFEYPYTWNYFLQITNNNLQNPIFQAILGLSSFSLIQWILSSVNFSSVLLTNETLKSSLLNPFPKKWRETHTTIPCRMCRVIIGIFSKFFCIVYSDLFQIEGWFQFSFNNPGRLVIIQNFKKVLQSQTFMNTFGLIVYIIQIELGYSEIQNNYSTIYDIIVFRTLLLAFCMLNLSKVSSIIKEQENVITMQTELKQTQEKPHPATANPTNNSHISQKQNSQHNYSISTLKHQRKIRFLKSDHLSQKNLSFQRFQASSPNNSQQRIKSSQFQAPLSLFSKELSHQ
uniref:MTAp n=1 Tax=Tetrahymena paravorax TaxID=5905 RepID=A0A513X5C4_TETPR|nr:MTAp [Tetrahymena paravorax]